MRKLLVVTLALVFVAGTTGIVFAGFSDSNMDEGLTESPAFTEGKYSEEHFNGAPRMDTENGRIAVDVSEPGENSDEDSAVSDHDGDSLIDTEKEE